ncbi:Conserved oligomeric Golgi complex subunit 1 [Lucilia cuprina]|uniref:Conserved oligomeric Golgi complex subunit 1 n=1 Tax=Lucilia cuprina TaxID=7375 RepID=A0A0L0CEL9_LUCCU|nr:Conserved oligomeric Golgi complex subunit 1 [Lucilia cuprina]KNC29909.1 Conserved oligomeric Golgi complex subunit 1 [Lucilia cuprina]
MATLNLLNLNVDTLFEQHSVVEIDSVHKKIQEVVENKREELRTMVGERYRDLLKAADTITAMQDSTKALITQVDNINGNCKNLNEQQLLGFKMETDSAGELKNRNANKQLNNYFSTMIQIKLLTSLPELIWSQLDREHYYAATELFIFSRHISTGLQLDSNNPIMQKLPVAKKQWEIIKPFHMTIKQQVMLALERENLGAELTIDCILSLLQLERCTLESALKTFLNLRCTAFLNCLNADSGRVKERILSSLRVLNDSLDMVAKCFMDKSPLFTKLAEYSESSAPPTILRMDNDDVQFAHLLPDIITNFKPKFDAFTLNNEAVRLSLEQFLSDTQRIASNQLKQLFDLVTHMNSIQEIKTEANNLKKQLNLNALTTQFQLTQSLDFYELRYVPLINQRIRNIINDSWLKTIKDISTNLENCVKQPEIVNIKNYSLWQEFPTDLPKSLDQALNDDLKMKKLHMKSKGYNDEIIKIVTKFDENLADIIKEMNVLLEEPTAKLEDKQALVEFLKDTAQQHITEFITKVKSLQLDIKEHQSWLFVTRCCCALIELCPHLKMCFCQSTSWRQLLGISNSSAAIEHWQRICGLMEDEIYKFWLHIIKGLLEEYNCERYLAKIDTCNVMLEDFTHWEQITLDQKDDQDMPIQSTFRIPTQPRISLQSYLQILITSLKEIVPETLPSKVLHTFNQKLIDELLKHYQQLLNDHPTLTQNIALQLYFDIKFLQSSFNITREQKDQITSIQNAYKELIDPFDFELFSSQLMTNIKRSVLRSNCLLGVLTPLNMQTSQTGAVAQEKDPNVLSLCSSGSTSLWFPLLPVVTNTSNVATTSLDSKKVTLTESPKTTPTRKSTTTRKTDTKSKSGAASFFGAMSQEWFR